MEILDDGQKIMDIVLHPCKLLIRLKEGAKGGKTKDLFILDYRNDGVYLTVLPPSSGLTKEQETAIVQHISRKKIEGINRQSLFQAIFSKPGQRVQIAPPQQEKDIDEDIEVFISDDHMQAYVTLLPPLGGNMLSKSDIIRLLQENGVVFELMLTN